jgi:hypothetical protein
LPAAWQMHVALFARPPPTSVGSAG